VLRNVLRDRRREVMFPNEGLADHVARGENIVRVHVGEGELVVQEIIVCELEEGKRRRR